MNLIKLVQLLNNATSLSSRSAVDRTSEMFSSIFAALDQCTLVQDIESINNKQREILSLLESVDEDIKNICQELQKQIDSFAEECHQKRSPAKTTYRSCMPLSAGSMRRIPTAISVLPLARYSRCTPPRGTACGLTPMFTRAMLFPLTMTP